MIFKGPSNLSHSAGEKTTLWLRSELCPPQEKTRRVKLMWMNVGFIVLADVDQVEQADVNERGICGLG